MLNILHTPVSKCIAAVMEAISTHGAAAVTIDDDGEVRVGNPNSAEMRRHEINHPHLTVTTYTRAIKPSDVLGDIAARLGELSTYGMDRVSRR